MTLVSCMFCGVVIDTDRSCIDDCIIYSPNRDKQVCVVTCPNCEETIDKETGDYYD